MQVYDGDWEANTRHGKGMLKVPTYLPMTRDGRAPRHTDLLVASPLGSNSGHARGRAGGRAASVWLAAPQVHM